MKNAEVLFDNKTGMFAYLIDEHRSHFLVFRNKSTPKGINCSDWFEKGKEFNKRFKFVL